MRPSFKKFPRSSSLLSNNKVTDVFTTHTQKMHTHGGPTPRRRAAAVANDCAWLEDRSPKRTCHWLPADTCAQAYTASGDFLQACFFDDASGLCAADAEELCTSDGASRHRIDTRSTPEPMVGRCDADANSPLPTLAAPVVEASGCRGLAVAVPEHVSCTGEEIGVEMRRGVGQWTRVRERVKPRAVTVDKVSSRPLSCPCVSLFAHLPPPPPPSSSSARPVRGRAAPAGAEPRRHDERRGRERLVLAPSPP